MTAPLDRVKALLAALPRPDQEDLVRFLHDMLITPEEVETRHVASLETRTKEGKALRYTYRNEWIRCGRDGCRCMAGERHGPYTYRYWKEEGKLRKQYVGKAADAASTAGGARDRALRRPGAGAAAGRARRSSGASRTGPRSRA